MSVTLWQLVLQKLTTGITASTVDIATLTTGAVITATLASGSKHHYFY